MDGLIDSWMDRWMNGRMDGCADIATQRSATTHLLCLICGSSCGYLYACFHPACMCLLLLSTSLLPVLSLCCRGWRSGRRAIPTTRSCSTTPQRTASTTAGGPTVSDWVSEWVSTAALHRTTFCGSGGDHDECCCLLSAVPPRSHPSYITSLPPSFCSQCMGRQC